MMKRLSFIRLLASIVLIAVFMLPVTPVYAQSDEEEGIPITTNDVEAIRNGTAWWDPFWDSCNPENYNEATSPTKLVGKDNIERSYNYFIGKKLEPHQSAGIVGNLRQESGSAINPKSNQKNGPGRGIAQWSEGGRWDALVDWSAKDHDPNKEGIQGRDPEALDTQLDYIWYEMTEVPLWKETLAPLKASKTVEEATLVFMQKFEKAGDPHMENRYDYAREVLTWYGGGVTTGQPNTESTDPGSPCGGSGILVEGYSFPIAPRTRRNYTNLPCNSKLVRYADRYGQSATIMNCHPGDKSPAFDLFYEGVDGVPVYAITKGTITKVSTDYMNPSTKNDPDAWGRACASIMFRADNGADKSYYWYGHILNPSVSPGQPVEAGTPIAVVAPHSYGNKCWGGTPHLHIDRGCKDPKGEPQTGGGDNCRDPNFQGDLKKIWEGLPE